MSVRTWRGEESRGVFLFVCFKYIKENEGAEFQGNLRFV